MAEVTFNPESSQTIKMWDTTLAYETFAQTWFSKFIGKSDNSIIQIKNDFSRGAGDELKTFIRMLPKGRGVLGDNVLEGMEEGLSFFEFKFKIDQLRHAFAYKGRMSQQRVTFNIQNQCKNALRDWWSMRRDREVFIQLSGYTGGLVEERGELYDGSDLAYSGRNKSVAPNPENHFIIDTSARTGMTIGATPADSLDDAVAKETALETATGSVFDVNVLDNLIYKATTMSPMMRAPMIRDGEYRGENMFCIIIDPAQKRDLRKSVGDDKWRGIQRDALQGGKTSKNPIFTGAIGIYNNVVIHVSNRNLPRSRSKRTTVAKRASSLVPRSASRDDGFR